MSFFDKFDDSIKINLFLGDFITRNVGYPTRVDIAKLLTQEMNDEIKTYVTNENSLFHVCQIYLDGVIGSKNELIKKIKTYYDETINPANVLGIFSENYKLNAIFSIDYDTILDDISLNKMRKILISDENILPLGTDEIKHYKILGDISRPDKMFISNQDFRKIYSLNMNQKFFNQVKKEMLEHPTIIFGIDMLNSDLLEVLEYILKDERQNREIYAVSNSKNLRENTIEKIKSLGINLLPYTEEDFFIELKDYLSFSQEKLNEKRGLYARKKAQAVASRKKLMRRISGPDIINIAFEDFKLMESALEIVYSSLKLDKLPIEFSTIKNMENQVFIKTLGVTTLKIKQHYINSCNARIVEIGNSKYLELENREFKIGFEIDLKINESFTQILNNYYYEINKDNSTEQLKFVAKIFKEIFLGAPISFTGKLEDRKITFKNKIENMKFSLLYQELENLFKLNKDRLLLQDNAFYKLGLLTLVKEKPSIKSWVNFKLDLDKYHLIEGDRIVTERIHTINSNEFDVKEKIIILDPFEEKELGDKEISSYRRRCEIIFEKVPK